MTAFFTPAGFPGGSERDPAFRRFLAFSALLHVVLLAAALSATLFSSRPAAYRPSYTVDLVSVPSAEPMRAPAAPAATRASPAEPAARTEKKPAARPREENRSGAAVKAAPPVLDKAVEDDLKRQGDEAARARKDRLRKIEDLEKEAQRLYENIRATGIGPAASPAGNTRIPATRPGTGAVGAIGTPGGAEGAAAAGTPPPSDLRMKAYYDRIWEEIRASWILPEGVSSADERLLAVVGIRISPTGQIEYFWVERSSGNLYFDQSAIRAVNKANPLPPPPRELGGESLEVGINFRVSE